MPHSNQPAIFSTALSDGVLTIVLEPSAESLSWGAIEAQTNELTDALTKQSAPKVLLDLAKLRYCGSSLVAIFLRIKKAVCHHGGTWAICNVTPPVADVFRRTQLDTIWPIYASREDAYASLY